MEQLKKIDFFKNKKVFIIAEAGINHNGSFKRAVRLIKEAAWAGADAVKFQNFKTEDFIFDRSLVYTYWKGKKKISEPLWDLCKRCEMKTEWLRKLKKVCDGSGIMFISTPTSERGVQDLVDVNAGMIKNGSDYLSHVPLLKYMGGTGKTIIISTGMAYRSEIRDAIHAVRAGGRCPIVLLHCTSVYPTKTADVNLRRITVLKKEFGLPVGFSDHTVGSAAAVQAVALGVCMLEKHFTLSHRLAGPDHRFSVTPAELKQYVRDIRDAAMRMGNGAIAPAEAEKENRGQFRLSLISKRDLPADRIVTEDDFVIAKPGTGLPPKEAVRVIGKSIRRNIKKGTPLKWEHFR